MSGHRPWREIRRDGDTPEYWAALEAERTLATLAELREQQGMTQRELAAALDVSQANISQTERQNELYLSTVQRYVTALGGELRVTAVFGNKEVPLAVLPRKPEQGRKVVGSR